VTIASTPPTYHTYQTIFGDTTATKVGVDQDLSNPTTCATPEWQGAPLTGACTTATIAGSSFYYKFYPLAAGVLADGGVSASKSVAFAQWTSSATCAGAPDLSYWGGYSSTSCSVAVTSNLKFCENAAGPAYSPPRLLRTFGHGAVDSRRWRDAGRIQVPNDGRYGSCRNRHDRGDFRQGGVARCWGRDVHHRRNGPDGHRGGRRNDEDPYPDDDVRPRGGGYVRTAFTLPSCAVRSTYALAAAANALAARADALFALLASIARSLVSSHQPP
jgi:hypothetical protein